MATMLQQAQAALKELQAARSQWADKDDIGQSAEWAKAARAAHATVTSILEQSSTLPNGEVFATVARQLSVVVVEAGLGSDDDYEEAVGLFQESVNEAQGAIANEA